MPGYEHLGAYIIRNNAARIHLQGDVCDKKGHVNFPADDVCKQCHPDDARAEAIKIAARKAEVNLEIYTIDMLIAQKEQGILDNSNFLKELGKKGVAISFSK